MHFAHVAKVEQRLVLNQVLDEYCREFCIAQDDRARNVAVERLDDIARSGMHRADDIAIILRAMRG